MDICNLLANYGVCTERRMGEGGDGTRMQWMQACMRRTNVIVRKYGVCEREYRRPESMRHTLKEAVRLEGGGGKKRVEWKGKREGERGRRKG